MAISKNTPENIEDAAKSIFKQKILDKLSDSDAREALVKLIEDKIDWNYAYSVFSEYFPEIVSDSSGMTLDELIDAIEQLGDPDVETFAEWVEQESDNYLWLRNNPMLDFNDVVSTISQYMYDYEIHDDWDDCNEFALSYARLVYR